jgi:hypothetical protein
MNAQRLARLPLLSFAAGLALLAATGPAAAQTEVLKEEDTKTKALTKTATTVPDGWTASAKLGLSANLLTTNANAAAAGAGSAGASFQFGVLLGAEANLKHGQHGWENKLNVQHGQTKTPNIANFIKSVDNFEVTSTYFYRLQRPDWLGPFGRFKLQTQLFKGYVVREVDVAVNRTSRDGNVVGPVTRTAQSKISLTSAFEPLVLRQTVGMFGRPWQDDDFKFDGKLGVGAQEIVVRDGFVVASEADGVINLRQLETSVNAGAELEVNLQGVLVKDLLSWKASANFFLPVLSNADDPADPTRKANGFDFLNTDIQGGLSLKVAKGLSVDYALLLRKIPLVVDGFQVQHGLVFSVGVDIL